MNNLSPWIARSLDFAEKLAFAAGFHAYMKAGEDLGNDTIVSLSKWLNPGDMPDRTKLETSSRVIANIKFGELVHAGSPGPGWMTTPVTTLGKFSAGYMGGIRFGERIIAVSKLKERHDLLLAELAMIAGLHGVIFHHVGFRHESEEVYRLNVENNKAEGRIAIIEDDSSHMRTYYPVFGPLGQILYHEEDQFVPGSSMAPSTHWDIVYENPKELLKWIGEVLQTDPEYFSEPGENDPVGVIWITDGKKGEEVTYGVMARKTYWNIS